MKQNLIIKYNFFRQKFLITTLFYFGITGFCLSQKNINLSINNLGAGKTKIVWTSIPKDVKQISLQRSLDSINFFTTVFSPQNTKNGTYTFTDFYPLATKQVFYRVLIVTASNEILFSKSISRNIVGKHSLVMLAKQNNVANTPNTKEDIKPIVENKKIEAVKTEFTEARVNKVEPQKDSRSKLSNASSFIPQKSNLPEISPSQKTKKNVKDESIIKEYSTKKNISKKKAEVEKLLKQEIPVKGKTENETTNSNKTEKSNLAKDVTNNSNKMDDEVVVVSSTRKRKTEKSSVDSSKNEKSKSVESIDGKSFQDTTKKSNATNKNTSTTTTVRQYGAPGKLIGKVVNAKTGDPLNGATVTIKGGATTRTMKTDYNGSFSFSNIPSGIYEVTCTYVGYTTNKIDEVKVIKDDVTTQDITMKESKGKDLDDVVVKSSGGSKKNAETVAALLTIQKNAASVSDGISAEAIKRTPDKNTSDILKRVSGASIQDDKFAIIRGLADRYNAVFLNSSPLPSTESDRKAFSFDIFPANMLDNLTIVKTATPDMPGEFAGGLIFINTKDIPTKDFQSVTFGLGYNTKATFQQRKYYKGGRFDLLGLDDGTRALSANIPSAGQLPNDPVIGAQKNFAKYIANDWRTLEGINPVNHNFQYVRGLNIQRKNNDYLGILLAATYSKTYSTITGEERSIDYDRSNPSTAPIIRAKYDRQDFVSQVLAGLMGNVSLKINSNNKLSLKNLLSVNSEDKVITGEGMPEYDYNAPNTSFPILKWFTSNVIFSTQLLGEHFLPKTKLRINWAGAYTSVNRQVPNLRRTSSYIDQNDQSVKQEVSDVTLSPDIGGTMFYASTKENIKFIKTDLQRTFTFSNRFNIQFKAGFFLQKRQRDFEARLLGLRKYSSGNVKFDQSLLNLSEATIFDPKNFGKLKNGKGGFLLVEDYKKNNVYGASSNLDAAYLMFDTRLFKFIRINGGVRVEKFNQKLSSFNDNNQPVNLDTTVTDYLPSLNLIFALNAKQNMRLGYSKTLNRPEYRELAPFIYYDRDTRLSIYGDPNLKRATVDNYDLRYEIYPGKGQVFSLSGFYKKIINPIELVFDPNIDKTAKYQNTPKAYIYGAELEARILLSTIFKSSKKSFLNELTAFGNLAIMKSEIDYGKDTVLYGKNRSLQGQSPYLYNAGFIYQKENGFSTTLQINQVGQRIYIAGNISDAHVWDNSRPVVDLQVAKMFEKSGIELKLNVKDILAKEFVRFYDTNDNGKYEKDNLKTNNGETDKIFLTRNYGRIITASITYKF